MKKFLFFIIASLATFSCQQEVLEEQPLGIMRVRVANDPGVEVGTRAVSADYFNVYISGDYEHVSYVYKDMPEEVLLHPGKYTILAENVTEEDALSKPTPWGQIRYAGSTVQRVNSGEVTDANLTCRVANSAVSVVFDATLDGLYSDCSVLLYAAEERKLTHTPQTPLVAYFGPGTLHYEFSGIFMNETTPRTFMGSVELRAATHTHLTFKINESQGSLAKPEIKVDTTCEEFYEEIVVDPSQGL